MPEDIHDPLLGHLVWDNGLQWWVVELDLRPGQAIEIFADYEEDLEPRQMVDQAQLWFERLCQREPEYRHWTAERLIDRRWNDEVPMTIEDITDLLSAASLEVSCNGTAKISWDDEDELFAGHNIITSLSANGTCIEAGMQ